MKVMFFVLFFSAVALGTDAVSAKPSETDSKAFCNVNLFGGFTTTGGRCRFFDEVMTGIVSLDPLAIRCSRLQVTCNRDGKNVDVVMQKEETSQE